MSGAACVLEAIGEGPLGKEADMKTPIVREIRRAGQMPAESHRRQVSLVTRSLLAVPDRRLTWDERTRTEVRRAA
jgi:hypothetical protein